MNANPTFEVPAAMMTGSSVIDMEQQQHQPPMMMGGGGGGGGEMFQQQPWFDFSSLFDNMPSSSSMAMDSNDNNNNNNGIMDKCGDFLSEKISNNGDASSALEQRAQFESFMRRMSGMYARRMSTLGCGAAGGDNLPDNNQFEAMRRLSCMLGSASMGGGGSGVVGTISSTNNGEKAERRMSGMSHTSHDSADSLLDAALMVQLPSTEDEARNFVAQGRCLSLDLVGISKYRHQQHQQQQQELLQQKQYEQQQQQHQVVPQEHHQPLPVQQQEQQQQQRQVVQDPSSATVNNMSTGQQQQSQDTPCVPVPQAVATAVAPTTSDMSKNALSSSQSHHNHHLTPAQSFVAAWNAQQSQGAQIASQLDFSTLQTYMRGSLQTQRDLQEWDAKMGLRRSHSKTMRSSAHTRRKLLKLLNPDDPILKTLDDAGGVKDLNKKTKRKRGRKSKKEESSLEQQQQHQSEVVVVPQNQAMASPEQQQPPTKRVCMEDVPVPVVAAPTNVRSPMQQPLLPLPQMHLVPIQHRNHDMLAAKSTKSQHHSVEKNFKKLPKHRKAFAATA